jgi:lysine 6-dehydrogenase
VTSEDGLQVAVLGAGGIIARAIVRDLAESEEVAGLWLLDLDRERAAAVAAWQGLGKAQAVGVDARSEDRLASALEGCDVLVNSAHYRVNVHAMQAALRCGCHYLDLGGLYWMTGRQLELHERYAEANLLALLGMGSSPGKTNVMAARALRELGGEAIERIDVCAAARDPEAPPGPAPLRIPYSLQTLLDEVTLRPVVIEDGRPLEIEPLSDGGVFDYPAPIGPAPTIHTLHSELRTFPQSFGCRGASFRLSLGGTLLDRLRQLAGAPEQTIAEVAATALAPSEKTVSTHVVEATTATRRVRVSSVTVPNTQWGLGGGIVSTASPAAAVVRMLARGEIDARGALPPEVCIDPDALFAELEQRGCTFTVEVSDAARVAGEELRR